MEKRFKQEYPSDDLECWLTTDVLFFDLEALSSLYYRSKPPIETRQVGPFQVKLWEKPNKYSTYVMGSDVAQGLDSGDSSVSVVIEYQTGIHVASVIGKGDTDLFVDVSLEIANKLLRAPLGDRGGIQPALLPLSRQKNWGTQISTGARQRTIGRSLMPVLGGLRPRLQGASFGRFQGAVREGAFQTFDAQAITEMQSLSGRTAKPRLRCERTMISLWLSPSPGRCGTSLPPGQGVGRCSFGGALV